MLLNIIRGLKTHLILAEVETKERQVVIVRAILVNLELLEQRGHDPRWPSKHVGSRIEGDLAAC